MDGDAGAAQEILQHSPAGDVNLADTNGFTPLIHASLAGHLAVVRTLLAWRSGPAKVAVNTPNHTALRAAALGGHTAVLRELLAAGALPGLASYRGSTPLHGCARAGHLEACRLLVAAGADLSADARNDFHETAMDLAVARGDKAMVDLLSRSDR
jgi:ankyrin repeat protein